MLKNKNKVVLMVVVVALALLVASYYGVRALTSSSQGQLKASGTIETINVEIAPEVSGQVEEVRVNEGQSVKSGDVLLTLDDGLLLQQRKVAAAGLDTAKAASQSALNALNIAQAEYQVTLETELARDKQARLKDWFSKDQKQFDQPNWYFTRAEQIQTVQSQIDDAKKSLDDAQAKLEDVTNSLDKADFLAAEGRLLNARLAYSITKDVNAQAQNSSIADAPNGFYNATHCGSNDGYRLSSRQLTNLVYGCTGDQHLSDASQRQYDDAQSELNAAQQAYNSLLNTKAADDVLAARAEVSVTQERYYEALDRLRTLQTGDQSPSVTAAQGAVDQAKSAYEESQRAIAQAQANLDLLDAQLAKLTVYAPTDGVVLTRSIEPGEVAQAGAPALTIGNLRQMTITVYVPEDRYAQVRLGQKASVRVDSFPGTTFTGEVTHIADQAEFTPRNVQTAEGRSSTVYAIKLALTNLDGKLKPGMPADVVFQ